MIKPGKTISMSMIVEVFVKGNEAYFSSCPAAPYCSGMVLRKTEADWMKWFVSHPFFEVNEAQILVVPCAKSTLKFKELQTNSGLASK